MLSIKASLGGSGNFPISPMTRMLLPTRFIESCLPSTAERPPSGPSWIHEIKHDGYRPMARRDAASVRLLTHNGHNWAIHFPLIVQAVDALRLRSCLIDGEAVCRDEEGLPVFHKLRPRRDDRHLFLYAFDLIAASRSSSARPRQAPARRQARPAIERASSSRGRRVPARVPARPRRHRQQAPRLALHERPYAGLAQVQDPNAPAVEREDWGKERWR
jgi:ATP-dependent DNA ligase